MNDNLIWLCAAGVLGGFMNTIAAGGSLVHIPALMHFSGLTSHVANATNRISILLGNFWSGRQFYSAHITPIKAVKESALPICSGALAGAYLTTFVSNKQLTSFVAFLLLFIALKSLFDIFKPAESETAEPKEDWKPSPALLMTLYFFIGIYQGFIQAGTGFIVLWLASELGYSMAQSHAFKVTSAILPTVGAIIFFYYQGWIYWVPGLALGAGSIVGSHVGAILAQKLSDKVLKAIVAGASLYLSLQIGLPLLNQ